MSDFFEKVKDSAANAVAATSKAVKGASDSAKKSAEKSKIKRKIAALETSLTEQFAAVGAQCYEKTSENPDDQYVDLFVKIADLKSEIAKRQEELAMIDSTVLCAACGKQIAADALFCSGCGAKVEHPEPAETPSGDPVCPDCGAPVVEDALFCPSCGKKLAKVEEVKASDITVE